MLMPRCTSDFASGRCIYDADHSGDHLTIDDFGREARYPAADALPETGAVCPHCRSANTAPTAGNGVGNTMDCLDCLTDFTPVPIPSGDPLDEKERAILTRWAEKMAQGIADFPTPDKKQHARTILRYEATLSAVESSLSSLRARVGVLERDAEAYRRINTPEIEDFLSAVQNEALHQRERWGVDQDGGKTDADWFWLVGYLAGKALHDVKGKRLHHIITAAAALLNWHAHAMGAYARMRPGIADPDAILPTSTTEADRAE